MSELTTAARPYARAVFEMAKETGTLPAWSEQLNAMSMVVAADGSAALLGNPRMSKEQKAEAFADIAGNAINADGRNLIKVLGENDRFILLPEIAQLYEELRSKEEGFVEAELTSAYALTNEQQQAITAALQKRLGREIKLVTKVDSGLMGGAIIRAGDLVIDGSIQSRLKDLKNALSR